MTNIIVKKGLTVAVIFLFIGVCFQPMLAENTISVKKESDYNNANFEQAKEYLFQTIIDISNNPDVKTFLKENKHNLITNNCNYRNAFQKIFSQNPKLLKSILFTTPEMTIDYLEKSYKKGLEIIDILGQEESSKSMESVKIFNPEFFNELKNIILSDEKLSNRFSVLEELSDNVSFPIICTILFICGLPFFLEVLIFINFIAELIYGGISFLHPFLLYFLALLFPFCIIGGCIIANMAVWFNCSWY